MIAVHAGSSREDTMATTMQRAEAAEHAMSEELDRIVVKSVLYTSGERDPRCPRRGRRIRASSISWATTRGSPRCPTSPPSSTSSAIASVPPRTCSSPRGLPRRTGRARRCVLACLLHDIAIAGFIRSDHGYWSAQLLEPYVDEEVSWAIRYHQTLRFFADESVGYKYPGDVREALRRGLRTRAPYPGPPIATRASTSGT